MNRRTASEILLPQRWGHKDIVSSEDLTEDSGTGGLSVLNRIRQEVQARYQLTPGEISGIQTGR